jgi:hypothetical protein
MVNGILTKKAAKKKGRQEARSVAREPVLISTVTAIPGDAGRGIAAAWQRGLDSRSFGG